MTNHLFHSMEEAQNFLQQQFGDNESFDVGMEHLFIKDLPVFCVYITGLMDSETLGVMLAEFVPATEHGLGDIHDLNDNEYFETYFNFHGRRRQTDREKLILSILSGQITFITKNGYAFVVELRKYPGRNPEEPDNEKVVRGSRDGFTESINMNTALIRRRIRSPQLRFELHQISTIGQSDVAITYLKDMVNEEHLSWLRQRIKQIQHDGLTMADKLLEEWLFKQSFHPVPFVRYTERPDITAAHLLEGHVAILVDTSPSVILVPITMFHLLQHAEEYRQAPAIGSLVRLLRYFGTTMSLLLLPIWYLFATNPELLPESLKFLGAEEKSSIPLLLQIFIADIGIEFLRMAAIHTPTPLSTAMGLIAGVIIGQIAIDVGLFSSEVVLYSAITAIFTFAIPSYELSVSVKIFRILLLLATGLADQNGLFIAMLLTFFYLTSLKPMNVPYMWPLVPFFPKAFLRVFIRFPITSNAIRPYIVGAKQRKRS